MKYIVFFIGLLFVVPLCVIFAANSRRIREIVFIVLVISTAFVDRFDINFIDRWWYHGTSRGVEISFVDLLSLILLLSSILSGWRLRVPFYWPSSLGLILVFLAYGSLNVALSTPSLFGVFELFKMLRGLLAFLAVAAYVRTERDVGVFVVTFAVVLIYQGCLSVLQRYFWGYMRVQGSFLHPSALADYCCILAPILLSVGVFEMRTIVQGLCLMAWALAFVAAVLSITRMGITALVIASAGVFLSLMVREISLERVLVVSLCCVVGGGLFFRGYDKMAARHNAMVAAEDAGDGSAGRRVYYIDAWNMAKEEPLGVGLNNWSWWLSDKNGYPYESTSERGEGRREIMAHSMFALALGELGLPGLAIFVSLWVQWLWLAGQHLFARTPSLLSAVLRGCFFSLLAAVLAALTEHSLRNECLYIMFNILLGLVAAAIHMKRLERIPRISRVA